MRFLVVLLLLIQPVLGEPQWNFPAPGERQPIVSLSPDAREFTRAFNAAADRTRLVLVFSPT